MAKFAIGSRVVTIDGRKGSVTALGSLKTGTRGRPKVIATVQTDDGILGEFTLSELTAVSVAA